MRPVSLYIILTYFYASITGKFKASGYRLRPHIKVLMLTVLAECPHKRCGQPVPHKLQFRQSSQDKEVLAKCTTKQGVRHKQCPQETIWPAHCHLANVPAQSLPFHSQNSMIRVWPGCSQHYGELTACTVDANGSNMNTHAASSSYSRKIPDNPREQTSMHYMCSMSSLFGSGCYINGQAFVAPSLC